MTLESLLAGRYTLRSPLGRGAMGVVWDAWDTVREVPVALKTLRKVDPDGVYRLKQEFRARADIAHPNLVTLYELVADGDTWFLTMERIDGMPLLDWIRGEDWEPAHRSTASETLDPEGFGTPMGDATYRAGPVQDSDSWTPEEPPAREREPAPRAGATGQLAPDLPRLRDAFRQLAEGVHALHASDRLHRDLKPANVLVTRDGRVVLVDFGLAAELHAGATRAERGMAGTAAYMAPEQAMGLPLTAASDWYAVGVMLYEALTGLRPFVGSVARIIADKQTRAPRRPRETCDGVPGDLDELAMGLLARQPDVRPDTDRVLQTLGAGRAEPQGARGLVGRSRELRRLHRAWRRASRGIAVACVRGPSGMGKSVLVDHFLDELEAPILGGRCYEREQVPYNAFDDLVDDLAAHLARVDTVALPDDTGALRRVFPGLDRVPAIAEVPHPDAVDAQELRAAAFRALGELLADLGPVVLHLDDVQWGDEDSLRLLGALLDHAPPALVVLSFRDDLETPFLEGLRRALEGLPVTDVEVGTLTPREALVYALHLLGEGADTDQARSIAEESGGNPLFLEELARRARTGPVTSLDAVIRERVEALPGAQERLVHLVALAGRPTAIRTIARAASLDEPRPLLDLLRSANLLRTSADRVEPFHDRVREAVTASLAREVQQPLHRVLAQALEAEPTADPDALLRHWRGADEPERAAPWALRAADRAFDALAFDRAAAHYEAALELGAWRPLDLRDLWSRLGESLALAGRTAEAGRAWLEAAASAEDRARATDLERVAAESFLEGGHTEQGLLVADRVLRAVGLRVANHPRKAVLPLLGLRLRLWWRGLELVQGSHPTADDAFRLRVYRSMSRGLALIDFIQSEAFTLRHLLAALDAGDRLEAARGLAGFAATIAAGPPRDRAQVDELLSRAEALSHGEPEADALLQLSRSMIAFANGDWHGTTRWADAATHTLRSRCRGMQFELTSARLFSSWGLLFGGELATLAERLPGQLRQAREHANLRFLATGETELYSVVALMRDDPEAARKAIESCTARLPRRDAFQLPEQSTMLAWAQVDAYTGAIERGFERMESTWPRLHRSLLLQNRFIRLEGWALRGKLALAHHRVHRDRASLGIARISLKKLSQDALPWADGMRLLNASTLAELEGREDEAIALLRKAIERLAASGTRLYAQAGRHRLGQRLGGDEGAELLRQSTEWFADQGVVDAEALTRMCLGS